MNIIWVTDISSNKKVAINTKYITAVFEPGEGAPEGTVAIVGMIGGIVPVAESVDELIAALGSSN